VAETLDMCNNTLTQGNSLASSCGYFGVNEVAYDSGKGEIFATNGNGANVSVINDTTDTIIANVTTGGNPNGVAYDSGKGEIFVANYGTNNVSVISDNNNTVVANINVGTSPTALTYDGAKGEIFVANYVSSNVSVIADSNNTVVANLSVGTAPDSMAYDMADGEIFVTNSQSNNVSVISDENNTVVANLNVGGNPSSVAYDNATNEVYVGNSYSDNMSIIYGANNTVSAASVLLGTNCPASMAYDGEDGDIFVGSSCYLSYTDVVSVVNTTSNNVTVMLQIGNSPSGIAFDSGNGNIYVGDWYPGTVSIISASGSTPGPVISAFAASLNPVVMPNTTYLNVSASGGTGPLTYNYYYLPAGCNPDNTSSLSCQPATTGNFTIWVQVVDSVGKLNEANISLLVTAPPIPVINSFTIFPNPVIVDQDTTLNVSAYGGYGGLTYTYAGLPPLCYSQNGPSMSCAPGASGTYDVRVYVNDSVGNSASSTAPLYVNDLTLESVAVVPGSATLPPDGTQAFAAIPTCNTACNPSWISYTWWVNNSALGTVTPSNGDAVTFNAGSTAGVVSLSVTANSGAALASNVATINIGANLLTGVKISPSNPTLDAGGSQIFTATPTCTATCPSSGIAYAWHLTNGAMGTLSGTGSSVTFNAGGLTGTVGLFLNATLEGSLAEGSAVITITGPVLLLVSISPTTPSVEFGGVIPFTATPTCSLSCPASGIAYAWALTSTTVGSLSGSGSGDIFTAGSAAGTVGIYVNATLNGITHLGTTIITVTTTPPPTLSSVRLSPNTATVEVDNEASFTATPSCSTTCPGAIAYSWTLSNTEMGTLSGLGSSVTFTASDYVGTVGIFVNATLNGTTVKDSAEITITTFDVYLVSVGLSPADPVVSEGNTMTFTADPTCNNDIACPSGTVYAWSLTSDKLGTLSGSGADEMFTAGSTNGTVGVFVNASSDGSTVENHTTITIAENVIPTLMGVAIYPATATIPWGGSQIFGALPTCGAFSCSNSDIQYSWSLNNTLGEFRTLSGSIAIFTAMSTNGGLVNVSVVAMLNGVEKTAYAIVTITPEFPPSGQTLLGLPVAQAYALIAGIVIAIALTTVAVLFLMRRGKKDEPARSFFSTGKEESDEGRPVPPRPPYLPPVT
jgi:YVTN family beta-propeller protein